VMRYFNCEVVAVRWMCSSCDLTAVGSPGELPDGWVELDPPPWLAGDGARYGCPEHADMLLDRCRRQWSRHSGRAYLVPAKDYEELRATLRRVSHELERLRVSGERVAGRKP
jgi:hypothetical protein